MVKTYINIDEELHCVNRNLHAIPRATTMGPTGARLWVDYLEPMPGFCGAIDFIHKLNIPMLFSVKNSLVESFEPCKTDWYPSYLHMKFINSKVKFEEKKFITWDDCAVSCQKWENLSMDSMTIKLQYDNRLLNLINISEGFLQGTLRLDKHDYELNAVLSVSNESLVNGIVLLPGEKVEFTIAISIGIKGIEDMNTLRTRVMYYTHKKNCSVNRIVKEQQKNYSKWFNGIPIFISSDKLINKTWLYRWFILRHNLSDPRFGRIKYPAFYEGRSHKMKKDPLAPTGWEFSKIIPFSVPTHIMDARWYHDPVYCIGTLLNMKNNQDEDGFYPCIFVDKTLHSYANFIGWATYQFYLIHRDKSFIETILPSLKKQVFGERNKLKSKNDELIIEYNHGLTGKEYQPSYWYFHMYPDDCFDKTKYTPLKRVDRLVYHYLNLMGTWQLCKEIGDADESEIIAIAGQLKEDILNKMWDKETNFFYDLHYENDAKALVKNIVGFYPYWAQITGSEHEKGLMHLFNSNEFNTPCPFPSVAADCPVYQPEGGWKGKFIKGRYGCVWDGPTWPYTNSIVLDALAKESKRRGHIFDKYFEHYFREYSLLHYLNRDIEKPYLVEHYNSQTGELLSYEVDYNHSFYIDLVIKHIAGLNVERDRLVLDPVYMDLDYFILDNVKVNGYLIKITYKDPRRHSAGLDILDGYRLYIDNEQVLYSERLERMEFPFTK